MRSDGNRALIDLYFPQINYGIECDEEESSLDLL